MCVAWTGKHDLCKISGELWSKVDITWFQYTILFNKAKQTFSSVVNAILQCKKNWHFRTEPNRTEPEPMRVLSHLYLRSRGQRSRSRSLAKARTRHTLTNGWAFVAAPRMRLLRLCPKMSLSPIAKQTGKCEICAKLWSFRQSKIKTRKQFLQTDSASGRPQTSYRGFTSADALD